MADLLNYPTVSAQDTAAVLAFAATGQVILTRQNRGLAWRPVLDLPGSAILLGETPAHAAARGLALGTGLVAAELHPLGRYLPPCRALTPGSLAQSVHIFWAQVSWRCAYGPGLETRAGLVLLDWPELLQRVLYGEGVEETLIYAVLRHAVRVQQAGAIIL